MTRPAAVIFTVLFSATTLAQDPSKIVYYTGPQVEQKIMQSREVVPGASYVDLIEYTGEHGASVLRRTRPARAELHEQLTDVWYVIKGGGTLVTGGSLENQTQLESGELRGSGVSGGKEQDIIAGDFVRIPTGVPHWVNAIDGSELVYLVVKYAAPSDPAMELVFVPAKKIENNIRKAPANDIGESEINLIERTPQHAGILLRRTKPGEAEVHTKEADVWYVIDGGCILTVGGSVIEGKEVRPGQVQGTGIIGGTNYNLGKGDFMRIPPGVPHWVKKIEGGELVYMVVKYVDK